jgi:F0F1-type ATP synthase assembly protein I
MPDENQPSFLERSAKSLQGTVRTSESAESAASASYTLIGAIIVLGGVGYGLDWWLGTSPWLLLGGLVLGLIVGFYELAKAVFWRQ